MALKLTTWQKVKTLAGFVVVFLLVFATSKMDKQHFNIVQESFSKVYNEKLVAKDYIYRMSRLIQEKKTALNELQGSDPNQTYSFRDSLNILTRMYTETVLDRQETRSFESLKSKYEEVISLEATLKNTEEDAEKEAVLGQINAKINEIEIDLDQLAVTQVAEIKREAEMSARIIDQNDMIYKLEIGALVVIGIIIQLLIFVKPWE